MSKYTTGEIAKLCGVTVRTVQYYDTRGILVPTELSEGGRRLYSETDVRMMRIICFLRELGLPIDAISQILSEEDPGSVISLLLEQQEQDLKTEISERQEKLQKLEILRRELKSMETISVESIGDIAYICPQCHSVFQPTFKEAFWARHTPAARKLTCTDCGHHGFCVEVAREEADIHE